MRFGELMRCGYRLTHPTKADVIPVAMGNGAEAIRSNLLVVQPKITPTQYSRSHV